MAKPRTKRESNGTPKPELQPHIIRDDPIDEASKESFPASDSPASNAGHDAPPPIVKEVIDT
jgi:hypothetical protein